MTGQEAKKIIEQYWNLVRVAIEKGCCDESNFTNRGCIYLYIKGGIGDIYEHAGAGAVNDGEIAMRVDPYAPDDTWCYPVTETVFEVI